MNTALKALGILLCLVAGVIISQQYIIPIIFPPEISGIVADETIDIQFGYAYEVSDLFNSGDTIDVTIEVKSGGTIDILLLNSGDKIDWDDFFQNDIGSFSYVQAGSGFNVESIHYRFTLPTSDRYFVVLNNAGGINGGAVPIAEVTVYIKIIIEH